LVASSVTFHQVCRDDWGRRDATIEQPFSAITHNMKPHVSISARGSAECVPLHDLCQVLRSKIALCAAQHHKISAVVMNRTNTTSNNFRVVY